MPTTPLPSAAGCTLHDAGQEWDAIRVPRSVGLAALGILGQRSGAVVEDSISSAVYFFTPVGTAARWDAENTRALGEGSTVTIPPARRTEGPGVHWRICPGDGRWLTDPQALQAAIADAFGTRVVESAEVTA
ncbi:hypothetical protein ABZ330_00500 [Streptomyces sp. NPDC006172]|uniref:hypothetical protein n=1 Tax=Streptomyces sp. NPDC006172 TaxID=3154470 RepID=UPI0033E796CE